MKSDLDAKNTPVGDIPMSLEQLIAMDTQNPGADYRAIRTYLERQLKARGASVRIVAGNVLGVWGTPRLLLNAHMDTVRAQGWTRDPLHAWTGAGRTYGLGACDTKGNLYALLQATQDGPEGVAVLFSTDEECGFTTGARRFFRTNVGKKIAKSLRGAVVLEPTENRVIARHPGFVHVTFTFFGPTGHSSGRMPGAAGLAVSTLYRLLNEPGWNVNIASIGAQASGANIFASRCAASVSIRSYQDAADVIRKVKSILPRTTDLAIGQAEGPFDNKKPFVPSDTEVPYWTDATTFAQAGINAVVYGAGSIRQAHHPDEFVSHASLRKAVTFLKKLSGTAGRKGGIRP